MEEESFVKTDEMPEMQESTKRSLEEEEVDENDERKCMKKNTEDMEDESSPKEDNVEQTDNEQIDNETSEKELKSESDEKEENAAGNTAENTTENTPKGSDDDSNEDDEDEEGDDQEPSKARKVLNVRKNIKDVLDNTQLDAVTLAAQREESERLARFQEKQQLQREQYRQMAMDRHTKAEEKVLQLLQGAPKEEDAPKREVVTIEDSSSDDDCIVVSDDEDEQPEDDDDPQNSGVHTNDSYNVPDEEGRVLVNFGHDNDEPDVFLAPQVAKIIKPHQIGGIRFLFDNLIESVTKYEENTGFGCILAHSMGLGKTIQVVSFCDVFLRHTTSKTVLIIMPINTLQNWLNEFNMWIPETSDDPEVRTREFKVYLLNDNHRTLSARSKVVFEWAREGGVLMIGYEMYRLLSMKKMARNRRKKNVTVEETAEEQKGMFDAIHEALVKPGPDLVICDEGHRIKNSHASISVALKQIKSRRRVVLTGYPLQNNLTEYWCMVDFVRPNYLGTKTEFCNMFERPIQNGQCVDSTPKDTQLMRYRAHVLHSLLVGFVQRRSHIVLQQSLPKKYEFVLLVRMTDFQRTLYETFMNEVVRKHNFPNPLKAFSVCCKIWNHPDVLFNFLKKREADLDLELDDESTTTTSSSTVTPKKSNRSRKKGSENTTPINTPVKTSLPPVNSQFPKPEAASSSSSFSSTNYPYPPSYPANPTQNQQYQNQYKYSSASSSKPTDYPANSYQNSQYSSSQYAASAAIKPEGYQDYYQQPYPTPPASYGGYQQTQSRYDQYGGYYGSQYSNNQYAASQQGYPVYPNQYNQYPSAGEYGTNNYSQYPAQYPSQYPAREAEPTAIEKPKSPELPKTIADTEFDNKLADEIKDEVEGDKSSEKGAKDDTIPYDWAFELMKGYIPDLLENSPKMQIFMLLLEESVLVGDRILLFSQSLLTLNVIEKFLQKTKIPNTDLYWSKNSSYFRLDGSTVAQEREKLINNFNTNANVHLFLVSTRAGSLGINLVGANRVIVFDASWNPCHDTQAVCRVYRYGQKKPCYVYRLVMDACLEKKIYDRQISKQGMSDRVVDECNPEAHLSMKEVTSFCFDDDEVTEVQDFRENADEYADDVVKKLLEVYSKQLSKKPFQHEALLADRKEKKLSASEKRMARKGYELEKMNTAKPAYSYTSMGTTYRAYRTADGSLVHRAVTPQTRNFNNNTTVEPTPRGARPTTWIPAEVWQQQGMSAQEMTLPSDVVIPTSSADKENIVLKAGQRVMVLKSHKGIYMQLESGKIIAIRTTMKPENGAKKAADQPSTSAADSVAAVGGLNDSSDSKADSDDDDIIMTSITYPDQPSSAAQTANDAMQQRVVPSTVPMPYTNGARRRGRPPTYNGYHPSYIPAGVVPQPLQPYSHASAKNFASTNYEKSGVKENNSYIPAKSSQPPASAQQVSAGQSNHSQMNNYDYSNQQFSRSFTPQQPHQSVPPPPPYPAQNNSQQAQTNGSTQQSVRQWQ